MDNTNEDVVWEAHNAKWEPIVAAHDIAQHLRALRRLYDSASPEAIALLEGFGLHDWDMLNTTADAVLASAPVSVSDEQRWEVAEDYAIARSEGSSRDAIRDEYDNLTIATVGEEIERRLLEDKLYGGDE